MPELPEVESVRRGLLDWVEAATVTGVRVLDSRILGTTSQRRIPPEAVDIFAEAVAGRTLAAPQRRGKFLWVPFAGTPAALTLHLGMSGQLRIHTAEEPHHRHTRAVLELESRSGAVQLRFIDQRIFGHIGVDDLIPDGPDAVPASSAHIARDPLDPHWDLEVTARRIQRSTSALKTVLMDQTVVSGIGNIYADEALFRARVHPQAVPARTRISRLRAVLEAARAVMEAALVQGGTSFDSLYVHVNGDSGYFDRSLTVYGRTGQPCLVCGTPIRRLVVGGRGTHVCPTCQRRR
ncbi:MAG TPA: bifunctional DNA-formamidopyrimidine glycosylase/DNA-(apurinic or apyrimidinic site) lyase [Brevibacterium senegalense]|uniref:Formamidopyrimidine-DNA glycosylase n=1 Tax=Brevibacterium senegalense TaxID=1033736 RepID=A0A921MDH3_9MICO|nr:bifunctional DNA-formamidopyrimidine glycosylase/DNA-(apurinic or apyrimidinic site) lyase [Brevibacterium senegalense]